MGKIFYILFVTTGIVYIFWEEVRWLFHFIFSPKIKMVKGKIIALLSVPDPFVFSKPDNITGLFNYQEPIIIWEHFVSLEDENGKEHFIEITIDAFQELKKEEEASLHQKVVSFYLNKYFLFGSFFQHFKFEEITAESA